MTSSPGERAQATVEFALLLPLLAVALAVVVQATLVVRDQIHLTRATSAAARTVMVEPTDEAARRTMARVGSGLATESIQSPPPASSARPSAATRATAGRPAAHR